MFATQSISHKLPPAHTDPTPDFYSEVANGVKVAVQGEGPGLGLQH